jgi:hypothetical protein
MSFKSDLTAFATKLETKTRRVFVNVVAAAEDSIVNGSAVTGAPGQPVGQYGPGYNQGAVGGTLKASWQLVFESPLVAVIGTKSVYAKSNEDGIARPGGGPYNQRSTVGGRHSVALTIAGLPKIVELETAKVANG